MSIRSLLDNSPQRWISRGAPATDADIAALVSDSPFPLPDEYVELLRCVNGGEAELAIDPWLFGLWSANDAVRSNKGYEVPRWHPDYRGFGTSGGGVMFAFKRGAQPPSKVYGVPFDSISPEDVYVIATDLPELLRAIRDSSGSWDNEVG